MIDPATGEIVAAGNEALTKEKLDQIIQKKIPYFDLLFIDGVNVSSSLRDTLVMDKISSTEEAILEIYKKLRPSNPSDSGGGQ